MSVRMMAKVWDHATHYAGAELLVLLALADWANDEGVCWPSVDRIAQRARVDRRQVFRVLSRLRDDGVVTMDGHRGRGKASVYRIKGDNLSPFPAVEKGDISSAKKVTFSAEKGDIQDTLHGCINNEPSANTTVIKQPPPPTPSVPEGERARVSSSSETLTMAADRVCATLGFAERRVRAVVGRAMQVYVGIEGVAPAAAADLMVANYLEYRRAGPCLRFVWGPRKFFGDGHWIHYELWPIDQARADTMRRAMVGA